MSLPQKCCGIDSGSDVSLSALCVVRLSLPVRAVSTARVVQKVINTGPALSFMGFCCHCALLLPKKMQKNSMCCRGLFCRHSRTVYLIEI